MASDITRRSVGLVNIRHGSNLVVIEPSNIYDCSLGEDVFVGPFVEIQKGCLLYTSPSPRDS